MRHGLQAGQHAGIVIRSESVDEVIPEDAAVLGIGQSGRLQANPSPLRIVEQPLPQMRYIQVACDNIFGPIQKQDQPFEGLDLCLEVPVGRRAQRVPDDIRRPDLHLDRGIDLLLGLPYPVLTIEEHPEQGVPQARDNQRIIRRLQLPLKPGNNPCPIPSHIAVRNGVHLLNQLPLPGSGRVPRVPTIEDTFSSTRGAACDQEAPSATRTFH